MIVKDVLGECLVKMGEEDLTSKSELSDEEERTLAKLLAAFNIAYREAAAGYLPLYADEEVSVDGGVADISGLEHRILYPVSLCAGGVRRGFRMRGGEIASDYKGRATLRYAYLPDEAGMQDEIADMRLTAAALADGTLAEYYSADKVFDLAAAYDASFKEALAALRYKGRPMRLGAGRWSG